MQRMIKSPTIQKILHSPLTLAFGLLVLTSISYGVLILTMGMYWDDWPSLWFLHFGGPGIFPKAFALDRPVQGRLFVPTTAIFGKSLFAWQVFGILARWLSGLSLAWLLSSLWPARRFQVLGVVILFLVYPGFSQQVIAITYGHQFLIMALFLASHAIMVWSIRKPSRYLLLTGASLIIGLLSLFALEYFYGLELLRPVYLWLLLSETIPDVRKRLIETFKRWLPYLLMNAGFLVWRLTHPTPRGEVTFFARFAADPGAALAELARTVTGDVYKSAVLAWARAAEYLNFTGVKPNVVLLYLGVSLAVALVSILLLALLRSNQKSVEPEGRNNRWGLSALLVGLYALLAGGWPIWMTNLRLELSIPWNRFTEPMMLGACLAMVGLIDLLFWRFDWVKITLIGVLAGLSAGAQFNYALLFRQEWVDQRTFLWQLAWRAPTIEPGTALMTANLPFYSSTDNSLTAALNWIYAPDFNSRQMPYMMFDLNARLDDNLPSLDPDMPLFENYRATEFSGNTSNSLVFYYSPPRCLKILDLRTDRHYPNKPGYVVLAMPLSRLELIGPGEKGEPQMPAFLGPEPKHNWCYYFEKVDLAVQLGQWEKAASLADHALKLKPTLTSNNAPELIPLIYAYARSGKYEKAVELSLKARTLSKKMYYYMCDTWYYLGQEIRDDPEFAAAQAEVNQKFECTPP